MTLKTVCLTSVFFFLPLGASAIDISNPGFENGMDGWTETDPNKKTVSISGEAAVGESSVKVLTKDGNVSQAVTLIPNTNYRLSADLKGGGIIGVKADGQIFYDGQSNAKDWKKTEVIFNSGNANKGFIFASGRGKKGGRFDA